MRRPCEILALVLLILLAITPTLAQAKPVTIGSKKFTESVILAEMARLALEQAHVPAQHRRELGGSRILYDAVAAGDIAAYPEYTGTLRFEIFADRKLANDAALGPVLAQRGFALSRPLGFSDGYALAMRADTAKRLGLTKLSDLARHPELTVAVSNEFVDRADGWRALSAAYNFGAIKVRGIDHDLAYRAIAGSQIDVTDVYTTDAEIAAYGLVVLEDDRAFFPRYDAAFLYRRDLDPRAVAVLDSLAGRLDEAKMRELNRKVRIDGMSETDAAREALGLAAQTQDDSRWRRLLDRTREHFALVTAALALALVVALPLGVASARLPRLGALVLPLAGLLQTIPSLALFVMLIPLLGIGAAPTIAALFVYSLLPIVRNTHAGLTGIAPALLDSAEALGLSRRTRLLRIELPLALPTILAGVRTAAVIAVGLATLGAIIGAGGYGQPILTGIRLANNGLILEGAIPAAVFALVIEGGFHLLERAITPRGLRTSARR
ncbi:glycine betaine ABC transporter substrate-binding protein [Novosphingobium sp. 9U]|uniref:glycine betaine ABC transporter substrate-binding protein n=1 Tax=Novosphingobium sp. 9U TaxID=2653158 RepID=UPI0012F20291|nr:glycine betaine ABC transporter substrate-binding protein [Novosphingobium sp. 9U]VWX46985.1 L-proline glycine betaine binding ABC transporter protein ProX (TC 3.A.1.12.1) / Osmotic adaptation [Novosphingobium sp. 9U]